MKLLNKNKPLLIITLVSLLIIGMTRCSKLVQVDPPITSTNGDNVFKEDASAIAVLTGIYTNMSTSSVASTTGMLTNVCFTTGLAGDELKPYDLSDQTIVPYYNNNIQTTDVTWSNVYNMIFISNSAIEQLTNKEVTLTPAVRNQILGEAKFIRALCYFYLVNLYGDIPLAISTNYQVNRLLPRAKASIIYQQIIADLKDAQILLSSDYLDKSLLSITTERVRPTKWAASALLARTYLYIGDYVDAESQATSLISNSSMYALVDLNSTFLMNNREAIWQLQPVGVEDNNTANTQEGQLFDLLPLPGNYRVYLNETLVNSFDMRDQRRSHWIDSIIDNGITLYFPYKYKVGYEALPTTEYSTVMRLGEQYLIRAEARIHQGRIDEGIADLNILRTRATDLSVPSADQLNQIELGLSKDNALLAVERERKLELFTEWGHRWMDLKRTNRIDDVLTSEKPGYQSTDKLFPLPQLDIIQNPSLIGHQNPGYN